MYCIRSLFNLNEILFKQLHHLDVLNMLLSSDLSQELLLSDDLFLENLLLSAEQNLDKVNNLLKLGYTLRLFVQEANLF